MTPEKISSAEISPVLPKKENPSFTPESNEQKSQRENNELILENRKNIARDIEKTGFDLAYADTPVAAPTTTVQQQDTINAEKLIAHTDKQIAEKFGANAFARFNPEQFA